ncbi:MAG: hypothetical protein NTZ74_01300 [Chloroflexi bacterium]|nr:hypothetical protein [Chloroflexota bacterium]
MIETIIIPNRLAERPKRNDFLLSAGMDNVAQIEQKPSITEKINNKFSM